MKRTDAVLGKAALAVSLGMAAVTAQAVPIVFDFTGTVNLTQYYDTVTQVSGTDLSMAGQVVTGRLVVETDGLDPYTSTGSSGTRIGYSDLIMNPIELITSELYIGGVSHDVGLYSGDSGGLSAFEASGLPTCDGCSRDYDRLTITDSSLEYWLRDGVNNPPPPPGEYSSRFLTLGWSDPNQSPDFIDLSNGFEPLDLIQLASVLIPGASYTVNTADCADRMCTVTRSSHTIFNIDSLTVSTSSVPEPGTLALFAVGLLGGAVVRRSAVKGR